LAAATATAPTGVDFTGDIGWSMDRRTWSSVQLNVDAMALVHLPSAAALWAARTFGAGHATLAVADQSTRDAMLALSPLTRRPLISIDPTIFVSTMCQPGCRPAAHIRTKAVVHAAHVVADRFRVRLRGLQIGDDAAAIDDQDTVGDREDLVEIR